MAMDATGGLAKQVLVAHLEYLIGGLFVVMYAAHRFNTPPTNRSTTTWLRYHMAAKSYWLVGLGLFGLLAVHQPFQALLRHGVGLLGLDAGGAEFAERLSPPLLAALFLTVLLPRIPYLHEVDEWVRGWLQKVAAIPFEARRVSAELRKAPFAVSDAMRLRVTADLLDEGFHKEDLLFIESRAPQFVWTKIAALIRHLESLEADHGFAAFMAAYPTELGQLRAQYKALLPKARKCFRLTRDLPADADGRRSRVSDAVREYRDEFGEQARALLGAIHDFLARGVLQSRHSYGARRELLRDLGFDVRLGDPTLTLNQHVLLFVLLNSLLVLGFVVAEPSHRAELGETLFRSLRIAVLYNVAILCAMYRPRRLKLAQPDERGFPPVAWYLLAGVGAAGLALIVNMALMALDVMDLSAPNAAMVLQQVARDAETKYPWLLMTFVTAAGVACLADLRPGRLLTPARLRIVEGVAMAAVAMLAALVVWCWLGVTDGRPRQMQLEWLLFRSGLLGVTIGVLIPTWFRQARAMPDAVVSPDVPEPAGPDDPDLGGRQVAPVTPVAGRPTAHPASNGRMAPPLVARARRSRTRAPVKKTVAAAGLVALLLLLGMAGEAQAQPRWVVVNGVLQGPVQLALLDRYACYVVPDGAYWLDHGTGVWGYAGNPRPMGYIGAACQRGGGAGRPSLSERGLLYSPYTWGRGR
jgi:hypothetical protein